MHFRDKMETKGKPGTTQIKSEIIWVSISLISEWGKSSKSQKVKIW